MGGGGGYYEGLVFMSLQPRQEGDDTKWEPAVSSNLQGKSSQV